MEARLMNTLLNINAYCIRHIRKKMTDGVQVKVNPRVWIGMLAGIALSMPTTLLHAAPLSLPDAPISLSTSVNPNVMLLLDNSGSMNDMAWATGYNPTTTYTNWCGSCGTDNRWDPTRNTNLKDINTSTKGNIPEGTCTDKNPYADAIITDPESRSPVPGTITVPRYVVQGEAADGTTNCLILPDPDGNGKTRYHGNYLNYLFQTYKNKDLTTIASTVTPKKRITLAVDVMKNLVNNTSGMNFGLAGFYQSNKKDSSTAEGAKVLQSCNADNQLTISALNGVVADTYTPLAEALYEVTRYFRGLGSHYQTGVSYTSPIQYRCQKNFVVVVTDGYATEDTNLGITSSTVDPDVKTGCNSTDGLSSTPPCLPDWDEWNPVTNCNDPSYPEFSDGFKDYFKTCGVGGSGPIDLGASSEGYSLLLDDIAKFAYDIDLLSDPAKSGSSASPTDTTGKSYDDPANKVQNIETYTIGFTIANQMLEDAAHYGSGKVRGDARETDAKKKHYFTANDGKTLEKNLETAITSIKGRSSSSSAVAASSGFVGGSAGGTPYIFQGQHKYDNQISSWLGDLLAYAISDPATGGIDYSQTISAQEKLKAKLATPTGVKDRLILSYKPGTKCILFEWASLDTTQQSYFDGRQEILEYIRGSQVCETSSTGTCSGIKDLRDRNKDGTGAGLLGTFVGSAPVYITQPPFFYPDKGKWPPTDPTLPLTPAKDAPENQPGAEKYADFEEINSKRKAMIYVGSNDGMLHAFYAGYAGDFYEPAKYPPEAPTLEEIFAYVPNASMSRLKDYSQTNYTHRFYVDGTPTVIDAFFTSDNKWHTVLVGGLNKGGQGIYALDVTNGPAGIKTSDVLWEFTNSYDDASSAEVEGADLGYTYSRPSIVRMHNGQWAAVFGNGYNNSTGFAALYVVNIETGALIRKIKVEVGDTTTPNGLATVSPVDLDNDYIIDYIYAGDLRGNLWRFDVKDKNSDNWTILGRGTTPTTSPLFRAVDSAGIAQPITSQPEVINAGKYGVMILFGTGIYMQETDKTDQSSQTFYALLDGFEDPFTPPITRDSISMAKTTIISSTFAGTPVRSFTSGATHGGFSNWLVDLTDPGERVISQALVRGSKSPRVIFSSIVPTDDPCEYGGSSWLMELDARNGGNPAFPVIDVNGDGTFDNYYAMKTSGIQTSPTIVRGGKDSSGNDTEFKYISNSAAQNNLSIIRESDEPNQEGRTSWRQIK